MVLIFTFTIVLLGKIWELKNIWAKIGKCAEENPDLTYSLIKDILIGVAELDQGEASEYKFG